MPNDAFGRVPLGAVEADEVLHAFRRALEARGIVVPGALIADGLLHRCDAAGKNGKGDAAYLLHLDGTPAGGFINWRDGRDWESWCFRSPTSLSQSEQRALRQRFEDAARERAAASAERHRQVADRAGRIWSSARPADDLHAYLVSKGVRSHGLRVYKGAIVIPVIDPAGAMSSLQFIGTSGSKRFLKGGRVEGGSFLVGSVSDPLCIAEGYATAASIHETTGFGVVVAFHAGNLIMVASDVRRRYPAAKLIVCADDDGATEGNPGLTAATSAARAIRGHLAMPASEIDANGTSIDFNDVQRIHGSAAVRARIEEARAPAPERAKEINPPAGSLTVTTTLWRDPEPLTDQHTAFPYPVDALPTLLREAVLEVHEFVQAPQALVAASALASLSLAAQGLVNVRRDAQLVGPVSVYLLSVADSGERKSTCDAIFARPLREWELERREAMAGEVTAAEAAMAAFEAKKAGLLDAIKVQRRKGKDAEEAEQQLRALIADAPRPVLRPRLLYSDATPEALAFSLGNGWPSGAVLSAEAGAVFGSHGMGQDTILRNLALLNVLWDGGSMAIDRRSKPSFQLRGRRLTFGLMVQPEALRGFLERAGTLPRGTGFLARFLVAWPASTQGSRHYKEAPAVLPAVERFSRRIHALLDEPLVTDEEGALAPHIIDLNPAAQTQWISIHDCIEDELSSTGEFRDIRDVASKAGENVARLAALFHVLQHGPTGAINAQCVTDATAIVTWHLGESRRLLAAIENSPALAAAVRLDEWLCREARGSEATSIPTRRIFQFGPRCTRDSAIFKASIALLAERGRARIEIDGRKRYVAVNPALLDDDGE